MEQLLECLHIGRDPGAGENTIPLLDHQHFFLHTDEEKNKVSEIDGHFSVLSGLAIQLVKADQHLPFGSPSLWEALWCPTVWFAETSVKFGKSKREKYTQHNHLEEHGDAPGTQVSLGKPLVASSAVTVDTHMERISLLHYRENK